LIDDRLYHVDVKVCTIAKQGFKFASTNACAMASESKRTKASKIETLLENKPSAGNVQFRKVNRKGSKRERRTL